ncbi:MAG: hypothetical protein DCE86_06405 [Flavobacteriaceae bacterium]|uniref:hypothetical protein n=1 Tax=Flavobacterium sp. Leaf359 TaxID=1736351 RepID=UPI0006FA37A3|nr:hypothetical protein [Flavobacterium sp. Leaf359]KQS46098.1 hypothetical protein ASG38_13070 [Flavobacterium sp. Leaf359]PZO32865.1 MAG: hypothetical protein DCE86_06405 [Flavobacteriaceae bacterium]
MKKVLFLFLVSSLTFLSCDSSDSSIEEKAISNEKEDSKLERRVLPTMTAGQLHNAYLDEMYVYLRERGNINASNIHVYSREFFSTLENSNMALENYMYTVNNPNVRYNFSNRFNSEIENLNRRLDNSNFRNLDEFKNFVSSYRPLYIRERNDLIAWGYYTDVFSHSIIYWATNLEQWNGLINRRNTMAVLGESKCKEGGWWKRTWCNVKRYGSVDAEGSASAAIILILSPNPVTIGGVAGAGLGASAGAVIKDLIF